MKWMVSQSSFTLHSLYSQILGLWDVDDRFYYDALVRPDGSSTPLKVRSLVGLTPLFACGTIPEEVYLKLKGYNSTHRTSERCNRIGLERGLIGSSSIDLTSLPRFPWWERYTSPNIHVLWPLISQMKHSENGDAVKERRVALLSIPKTERVKVERNIFYENVYH